MPHSEFVSWQHYFEEAPFDDHHRYHRPAVLVSTSMGGGDAQEKLDFLVPRRVDSEGEYSAADMKTLEAFGMKPPGV